MTLEINKVINFSDENNTIKEQEMKVIWILSWSWPEAGLAITQEVHEYLQVKYGAVDDLHYPDYILYNKPLRGFGVTWIEQPKLVEEDFVNAMKRLDNMWAEIIGIACNTLHGLLHKVEDQLDAQVVHLIHETCSSVWDKDNVLVLCSASTTKMWMYEKYLKETLWKKNVIVLSWENQQKIDDVIKSVMWWNQWKKEVDIVNEVIARYQEIWEVDAVILWCTELPLAYSAYDTEIFVASSNNVLARKLVEEAKK